MNDGYYFYVYCGGILGVKTNYRDFKWIYGSASLFCSEEEYKKCKVKFTVIVEHDKQITPDNAPDGRFQMYLWDKPQKTLFFGRTFFSAIKTAFSVKIDGNNVEARIGKNYLKYIKFKIMHMHAAYYMLSDIACVLLLKNGLLSLYASAVYFEPENRCVVCFAPPNTGKTVTAEKLCKLSGYKPVGEDVVITDGSRVYSCPWTNSFRKSGKSFDGAGAFGRKKTAEHRPTCGDCEVTDIAVLSIGEPAITSDKQETEKKISILNGYLFDYYSSPIIKILAYFDSGFDEPWNNIAGEIIKDMVLRSGCRCIQAKSPQDFSGMIQFK